MMIVITYDVNTTFKEGRQRLSKVAKVCQDYGTRVQNSVFECVLDSSQVELVKNKLTSLIDKKTDSLRFYFMGKNWDRHIEVIGVSKGVKVTSTLII